MSLTVRKAFALDQRRRGLSPETIRVRAVVLGAFEIALGRSLLTATKDDVNEWLDSLDLCARSRGKYLSHLRNFYAFAVGEELTEVDPTANIRRPKAPRLLPRPIETDALAFILGGASPKFGAMLALAAFAGLRVKEIAGQLAEDVLLDHDPPMLVVSTTKGDQPRVLPLAEAVEKALDRCGVPASGHLFLTEMGKPYRPGSISKLLAEYIRGQGVEATTHKLRHWFATETYRRSRDLRMVQELLGHASVLTTQGYVQWNPDEAVGVVRSLDALRDERHDRHMDRVVLSYGLPLDGSAVPRAGETIAP